MVLRILFSAVAHLVSGHQGGRGCFETTLAVLGFAEAVPFTILFLVPDILVSAFEPSIAVSLNLCVGLLVGTIKWAPTKRELRAELTRSVEGQTRLGLESPLWGLLFPIPLYE
jgi:hypothetical protein